MSIFPCAHSSNCKWFRQLSLFVLIGAGVCVALFGVAMLVGILVSNASGRPSLFRAIKADDPGLVRAALGHGIPVNRKRGAVAPIHVAVMSASAEVVQVLIDAGADPDAPGGKDDTPPLSFAASAKRPTIINCLILAGADIERRDCFGRTPLMYAAEAGAKDAAECLLKNGADPCARAGEFVHLKTAAEIARLYAYDELADLLVAVQDTEPDLEEN
jgi:ankyrin repeat protein